MVPMGLSDHLAGSFARPEVARALLGENTQPRASSGARVHCALSRGFRVQPSGRQASIANLLS